MTLSGSKKTRCLMPLYLVLHPFKTVISGADEVCEMQS